MILFSLVFYFVWVIQGTYDCDIKSAVFCVWMEHTKHANSIQRKRQHFDILMNPQSGKERRAREEKRVRRIGKERKRQLLVRFYGLDDRKQIIVGAVTGL